jgi:hypothetical protein
MAAASSNIKISELTNGRLSEKDASDIEKEAYERWRKLTQTPNYESLHVFADTDAISIAPLSSSQNASVRTYAEPVCKPPVVSENAQFRGGTTFYVKYPDVGIRHPIFIYDRSAVKIYNGHEWTEPTHEEITAYFKLVYINSLSELKVGDKTLNKEKFNVRDTDKVIYYVIIRDSSGAQLITDKPYKDHLREIFIAQNNKLLNKPILNGVDNSTLLMGATGIIAIILVGAMGYLSYKKYTKRQNKKTKLIN